MIILNITTLKDQWMETYTGRVKRCQTLSFFPDCRIMWPNKRVDSKPNKRVGAKSSLIKWSQDWSLDPWDQVVQEVEEGGGETAKIWSCCSKYVAALPNYLIIITWLGYCMGLLALKANLQWQSLVAKMPAISQCDLANYTCPGVLYVNYVT